MTVSRPPRDRPRLLVFVVAYFAEKTLTWVLERIPAGIFDDFECEILVVDDASGDATYQIGRDYREAHSGMPLTVLRNRYNQGYGGNQKVGYSYAIRNGFDYVALIHGDGQYAPEELPRLMMPLVEGRAEAVFGSRMMDGFGALRGGMPLYKYFGNRILTTAQNALLRTSLSEFHSGYRVYSVAGLERIHFELNTNDFHFDTQIINQLLNAEARIVELPIPTYYGDEISRVNGIRYAANVMISTISNAFHRAGLLQQKRLDPVMLDNSHYDVKLGFPSSHQWALDAVPAGASVIDLGAGPGGIAEKLADKGCTVAVVDLFPPQQEDRRIKVFVQDLDDELEFDVGPYEYVLLLDVIEHLKVPEITLDRLRSQFEFEPKKLVLTTPNIAFVVQRLMLLGGQFNYGKSGILDRTHTRLFTFRTIKHLLRDAGFEITTVRGIPAPFPNVLGDGRLARALLWLNLALIRISKTLFSFQIYIEADSTPGIAFVLGDAEANSR